MTKEPNLFNEDDAAQKVAKALGVDIGEKDIKKKEENESDSSKKTDTSTTEEDGRSGDEEKKDEKDPNYKQMYSDSTKEFQEVWKPVKDKLEKIEEISGKKIDDIIKDYENGDKKKDTPKKGEEEDEKQDSSIEDRLGVVETRQKEQEAQDKISAKKIIGDFCADNEISEDDYKSEYAPLLDGIKVMRKNNGEPYTLEEGLKVAYIIANKDNIDEVVEKRIKIMQKEKDLAGFSPSGKESSNLQEGKGFSDQQKEIAKKMGTDLLKKEE